ncbi:hypothetical protein ACOMHN_024353 [Nucella lapillus]
MIPGTLSYIRVVGMSMTLFPVAKENGQRINVIRFWNRSYGQIHCIIRELVQEKFGQEAWQTILEKSGLDVHEHFLVFTRYPDPITFKLVGAVSETLNVPVEGVLQVFGGFFLTYCLRHGYDKMLKTLGGDMVSFIQNLDSLHSLLALSYKGIEAPSFR